MRVRKKIKRSLEFVLVWLVMTVARTLPRQIGHRVFGFLGTSACRMFSRDRRRAVENLGVAFPEAHHLVREAMAKAMFKSLGRNAYEFFNLEDATPDELAKIVTRVDGIENFTDAHRAGNGVIVITGHIGCWEVMPAYFVSIGYPVSVVARRMKVPRLNARLVGIRESFGVETLDRDDSARRMIEVLRRGDVLGVLIDQHTAVAGTYVPFFGKPAFTPTAVAKLAMITGAPIVPMAPFLNRRGRHEIRVLPKVELAPGYEDDRERAVIALTARCSLAVEKLIRMDPTQWVWFHNRWREVETVDMGYAVQ